MILVVTGGRDWRDAGYVSRCLTQLHADHPITELVEGGATGVDEYAAQWARRNNIPVKRFPVSGDDWKRLGRRAGPQRNEAMAAYVAEHGGCCAVFHGGRGTANMRRCAEAKGLRIFDFSTNAVAIR